MYVQSINFWYDLLDDVALGTYGGPDMVNLQYELSAMVFSGSVLR